MGSIGLNFGSPTGGTGFDVTTMVSQLVTNLQGTETPYKNQLTSLQSEDSAISNLGTLLSSLSTDIQGLTSATGGLSGLSGSSSDTNVLALTSAGTGASAGSHSILVTQLAQTASVYGSPVASTDSLSGNLSIQVGSGSAITVAVDPSNNTVSGLAAAINQANSGVTASVVTGSGGEQLSLVSNTSGASGAVTVDATGLTDTTTGKPVLFSTGLAGQDAKMMVDGIPATSSSNTVTSVLPGVTFQLLSTSTSPIQVQIVNDTPSISTAVNKLVTDYNAVISALNTQEGTTSTGAAQPLYGNPLISTIQQTLETALSGTSASDPQGISSIGLSVKSDGTLALDTNALASALNSNFSSVVNLFQGASGVGETLATAVTAMGSTDPNGLLSLAASENASQEKDINSTLSTMNTNISAQQAQLTASLNAANETLQLIPTQLSLVNELYSAISGYGANKNG